VTVVTQVIPKISLGLEATMRRTVIKVRAAAALLSVGVALSLIWPQTASATTQVTATVGVNIRSGPSTQNDILGGLFRGQTVTAISSSHGWTRSPTMARPHMWRPGTSQKGDACRRH
jgi:hypothetical protein